MALPNFILAGDIREILGDLSGSELAETAATRAIISLTSNFPSDYPLIWEGRTERLEQPVIALVDSDGQLINQNGGSVRLLARHDDLVPNLQWQVSITFPGIPPRPNQAFRHWWIDAGDDGATIDLAATAPVAGVPAAGVAFTAGQLVALLSDAGSDVRAALDALYTGGGGGTGDFNLPAAIHAATGKATPVDADELALVDSAASNGLKKLTIANLKTLIQGLVDAGVSSVVAGAPAALNTLDELATAFGDDANFAATMTTALAGKVPTTRQVNGHPLSADVTVTKTDVGLGSTDNTADAAKPVSTAQAAADTAVLTSATGRAIAFAVALG